MPKILEHVAYLSKEIGPRPAGTEEEQQAALYIAETMQKETGLSTTIEDFNSVTGSEAPRVICCVVAILVTVLSLFVPVLAIASIVVVLLAALLFACEVFDRPIISQILPRGVSQNVVAKYDPSYTSGGSSRRRKIVLVTRYDSGKVRPELIGPLMRVLPILRRIELGSMILLPLLLIVRNVFFLHAADTVALTFNVLTVIVLIVIFLPVLGALIHKFSAYNEGANCNASGAAVLMDVALRVGQGRVGSISGSMQGRVASPLIHGEEAAREAGLAPEGAQLFYEEARGQAPETTPQTPEARLAAAKAAVAALTGKPVRESVQGDRARAFSQNQESSSLLSNEEGARGMHSDGGAHERVTNGIKGVTVGEDAEAAALGGVTGAERTMNAADAMQASASKQDRLASTVSGMPVAKETTPDWYIKAQEKAKKAERGDMPAQRSRYAKALDAAVGESASHFSDAIQAVVSETEQRLRQVRENIMEVKAPGFETEAPSDETAPFSSEAVTAHQYSEQPDGGAGRLSQEQPVSTRRPITLPTIGSTSAALPVTEMQKQRAPLADAESSGIIAAKSLLSMLPAIDLSTDAIDGSTREDDATAFSLDLGSFGSSAASTQAVANTTRQSQRNNSVTLLKNTLPSLSGSITMEKSALSGKATSFSDSSGVDEPMNSAAASLSADFPVVNLTHEGAFTPGATGSFAPVGTALLENVDSDDIFVDDADDSGYDGNVTETGAFAGPGYVEMPKSRAHRLLDKLHFGRRKEKEEQSAREWLNVDESFDARSVGAARGSWESFNSENDSYSSHHYADDYDEDNADDINVGGTSRKEASRVTTSKDFLSDDFSDFSFTEESLFYSRPEDASSSFSADGFDDDFAGEHDDSSSTRSTRRRWHGGAFSRRMMSRADEIEHDADQEATNNYQDTSNRYGERYGSAVYEDSLSSAPFEPDDADVFGQIHQFQHSDINTEVWFVALGSELAQNGGMRAFLKEHAQDLRGSIVIDLEAMGAGDLSLIEREGTFRDVSVSSRMKRYVKKAAKAVGIQVPFAQLRWQDSAASYAIKQGYQAMHLVGMSGSKPAYYAQRDDDLACIDENLLLRNSDFVIELIRNI